MQVYLCKYDMDTNKNTQTLSTGVVTPRPAPVALTNEQVMELNNLALANVQMQAPVPETPKTEEVVVIDASTALPFVDGKQEIPVFAPGSTVPEIVKNVAVSADNTKAYHDVNNPITKARYELLMQQLEAMPKVDTYPTSVRDRFKVALTKLTPEVGLRLYGNYGGKDVSGDQFEQTPISDQDALDAIHDINYGQGTNDFTDPNLIQADYDLAASSLENAYKKGVTKEGLASALTFLGIGALGSMRSTAGSVYDKVSDLAKVPEYLALENKEEVPIPDFKYYNQYPDPTSNVPFKDWAAAAALVDMYQGSSDFAHKLNKFVNNKYSVLPIEGESAFLDEGMNFVDNNKKSLGVSSFVKPSNLKSTRTKFNKDQSTSAPSDPRKSSVPSKNKNKMTKNERARYIMGRYKDELASGVKSPTIPEHVTKFFARPRETCYKCLAEEYRRGANDYINRMSKNADPNVHKPFLDSIRYISDPGFPTALKTALNFPPSKSWESLYVNNSSKLNPGPVVLSDVSTTPLKAFVMHRDNLLTFDFDKDSTILDLKLTVSEALGYKMSWFKLMFRSLNSCVYKACSKILLRDYALGTFKVYLYLKGGSSGKEEVDTIVSIPSGSTNNTFDSSLGVLKTQPGTTDPVMVEYKTITDFTVKNYVGPREYYLGANSTQTAQSSKANHGREFNNSYTFKGADFTKNYSAMPIPSEVVLIPELFIGPITALVDRAVEAFPNETGVMPSFTTQLTEMGGVPVKNGAMHPHLVQFNSGNVNPYIKSDLVSPSGYEWAYMFESYRSSAYDFSLVTPITKLMMCASVNIYGHPDAQIEGSPESMYPLTQGDTVISDFGFFSGVDLIDFEWSGVINQNASQAVGDNPGLDVTNTIADFPFMPGTALEATISFHVSRSTIPDNAQIIVVPPKLVTGSNIHQIVAMLVCMAAPYPHCLHSVEAEISVGSNWTDHAHTVDSVDAAYQLTHGRVHIPGELNIAILLPTWKTANQIVNVKPSFYPMNTGSRPVHTVDLASVVNVGGLFLLSVNDLELYSLTDYLRSYEAQFTMKNLSVFIGLLAASHTNVWDDLVVAYDFVAAMQNMFVPKSSGFNTGVGVEGLFIPTQRGLAYNKNPGGQTNDLQFWFSRVTFWGGKPVECLGSEDISGSDPIARLPIPNWETFNAIALEMKAVGVAPSPGNQKVASQILSANTDGNAILYARMRNRIWAHAFEFTCALHRVSPDSITNGSPVNCFDNSDNDPYTASFWGSLSNSFTQEISTDFFRTLENVFMYISQISVSVSNYTFKDEAMPLTLAPMMMWSKKDISLFSITAVGGLVAFNPSIFAVYYTITLANTLEARIHPVVVTLSTFWRNFSSVKQTPLSYMPTKDSRRFQFLQIDGLVVKTFKVAIGDDTHTVPWHKETNLSNRILDMKPVNSQIIANNQLLQLQRGLQLWYGNGNFELPDNLPIVMTNYSSLAFAQGNAFAGYMYGAAKCVWSHDLRIREDICTWYNDLGKHEDTSACCLTIGNVNVEDLGFTRGNRALPLLTYGVVATAEYSVFTDTGNTAQSAFAALGMSKRGTAPALNGL